MTEIYKGERVDYLLGEIDRLEKILKDRDYIDPFSKAQFDEYCYAYSTLTIAKAKLRAIKGEKL
jgi:hypothetical protein